MTGAARIWLRIKVIACGLIGALVLVFFAAGFSMNGAQWGCWASAAMIAALLTLAVAVWIAFRLPGRRPRPRVRQAVGSAGGLALLGVSLAIMARRYSDPYGGSHFWPIVLSLVGLAGFFIVVASVAFLLTGAPRETRRRLD